MSNCKKIISNEIFVKLEKYENIQNENKQYEFFAI